MPYALWKKLPCNYLQLKTGTYQENTTISRTNPVQAFFKNILLRVFDKNKKTVTRGATHNDGISNFSLVARQYNISESVTSVFFRCEVML
jgi:hypothetical protein